MYSRNIQLSEKRIYFEKIVTNDFLVYSGGQLLLICGKLSVLYMKI